MTTAKFHFIAFLIVMAMKSLVAQTYEFKIYKMDSTPAFSTNSFKSAAIGKFGHVWIGSANQGLYRFNGSTWSKSTALQTHNIRGLYPSPVDSAIWVAQSGTNSTNTNGGVNRIADTNYTNTYYGSIAGAPTRYTYGIVADMNNIAWSAHGPHLTVSVVTGGGIGKFITGSPTATSIYAGLPSGNYADDRRCLSIGTNKVSEFWVGVDRSCYNGVCNDAYIARYNLSGNYLGNITSSNSPIQFNNLVGGPVARAIDFDSSGRVWVGLSTGGLAVYDNGTWSPMLNLNIGFPPGAAVNFQSITHDDQGGVYIGTNSGLLIYDGIGAITDPESYALYNANNGLPSSNVTGVAIAGNYDIWLATTAGIVKMSVSEGNTIEGNILNDSLNFVSGNLVDFPLQACSVYLKDNNVFVDTVITNAQGYFKFDSLDDTHVYDLIIEYVDAIAMKCTIPDAYVGIPYNQIKIPYSLHLQLKSKLGKLNKKLFDFPWLFDLVSFDFLEVNTYDTSTFSQYERAKRDFTINEASDNVKAVERCARLLVQSEVMLKLGDNAASTTGIFTKESVDLGFLIFEFCKNKGLSPPVPSLVFNDAAMLLTIVNTFGSATVKSMISSACSYIDDPALRQNIKKQLNASFDAASMIADDYSVNSNGQGAVVEVIKKQISDAFVKILTPGIFKYYYVGQTAPVIQNAMLEINTYPYQQSFSAVGSYNIASSNASSRVRQNKSLYVLDSGYIDQTNTLANFSGTTSNILNYGSQIFSIGCIASGGILCPAAVAFKGVALALKALNFVGKGINVATAGSFIYKTKTQVLISAPNIFDNSLSPQLHLNQVSTSNFQTQNSLYNQKITQIGNLLQNGNRDSVRANIASLTEIDATVSQSMLNLSKSVFSVSPAVYQDDSTFSDYLSETFINNSLQSVMGRNCFNYLLVSYLIDSLTDYSNDLITVIPEIIQKNNRAVGMYDSLLSAISTYPPSQVLFASLNYTGNCNMAASYPVTVNVQNISNTPVPSVYALLEVNNGVTCTIDSINIGAIPGGQTSSATFYITTPLADTTAQISVTVSSPSGAGDADGGALDISGIAASSNVQNVVVPAGVSGCYDATQTVTIAGNNTTFTVNAGGSANVIAGQKIFFKPGTKVFTGGYLHGHITTNNEYCMPSVPAVRSVPTTNIASGITSCLDATQTIDVAGNSKTFTVQNGGNATFVAGTRISFLPGTRVYSGGIMHGYITTTGQYCGTKEVEISISQEEEPGKQPEGKSGYRIYPNPTTGQFILEYSGEIMRRPITTEIFDMRGENVFRRKFEGSKKYEISLEGQLPGIYVLRVISGENAEVFKIIKR